MHYRLWQSMEVTDQFIDALVLQKEPLVPGELETG